MKRQQSLAVSTIQYCPDLTNPKAKAIPLGVALEINMGEFAVFGVLARASLTKPELAKLDEIGRQQLASPKEYLFAEFGRATREAPNAVLEFLSSEHAWSLQVSRPVVMDIPADLQDPALEPDDLVPAAIALLKSEAKKLGVPLDKKQPSKKRPATARQKAAKAQATPPLRYAIDTRLQPIAAAL